MTDGARYAPLRTALPPGTILTLSSSVIFRAGMVSLSFPLGHIFHLSVTESAEYHFLYPGVDYPFPVFFLCDADFASFEGLADFVEFLEFGICLHFVVFLVCK